MRAPKAVEPRALAEQRYAAILSVIGGLALGLVLGQFPEYAQQYTQRLGRAVDELRVIAENSKQAATAAGLTREEAIGRYATTGDDFIEEAGALHGPDHRPLRDAAADARRDPGRKRLGRFKLLSYLDSDIGRRALEDFEPAVPVTAEGLAYAGGGFLLGYLVVSGLVRLIAMPFRRQSRPA